MRLWIFSDLHIESCVWDLPNPAPYHDVIIAAGDIHDPASRGVEWLAERSNGKPVIYVPGNHEWYAHREWFTVQSEAQKSKKLAGASPVHFLMDEAVIIDGVRFLGATLWTDWELFNQPRASMAFATMGIHDHMYIYPDKKGEPLSPKLSQKWHLASRRWLEAELSKSGTWDKTVVVTHHLPHPRSIATRFSGDALTPAFCSDMSDIVENSGAVLWVHGHTHDSFDYMAGSTRVVCNPKGYGPRERGAPVENRHFDSQLVVRV